jgi:cell division protein FtsZ
MNLQTQIKNNNMFFDIQPEDESLIKVIGVGGGGNNAVNFMYKQGIEGVNFIICNTDQQSLANSEVPNKIQLGPSLTGGRGAGAKPEVGKEATIESEEEIRKAIGHNTQMVFVTAGMGGGTGTGGAPIVAKIAKDMGILTVGIVTVPFSFEGKSKRDKANAGLAELSQHVDSLIVISNNKLREIYGNLSLTAAFSHADNILTTAARGISEIITKPGLVNVDFEDVKTVMMNSGVAIMGVGVAEGEGRATKAIDAALASPLLDENDIYGSRGIFVIYFIRC